MDQLLAKRQLRRQLLAKILKQILSGQFNSYFPPLDELMQMHTSVRQEYQAPVQRDTNNYGYMNTWDIGANEKSF